MTQSKQGKEFKHLVFVFSVQTGRVGEAGSWVRTKRDFAPCRWEIVGQVQSMLSSGQQIQPPLCTDEAKHSGTQHKSNTNALQRAREAAEHHWHPISPLKKTHKMTQNAECQRAEAALTPVMTAPWCEGSSSSRQRVCSSRRMVPSARALALYTYIYIYPLPSPPAWLACWVFFPSRRAQSKQMRPASLIVGKKYSFPTEEGGWNAHRAAIPPPSISLGYCSAQLTQLDFPGMCIFIPDRWS